MDLTSGNSGVSSPRSVCHLYLCLLTVFIKHFLIFTPLWPHSPSGSLSTLVLFLLLVVFLLFIPLVLSFSTFLPLPNLFFLVFSVAVLLSGLPQSTPALVGLSAASWMRTRPSALTVPHLPPLCRQATVTSGPRRDESVPRGTETTWAEPICTHPQTSLRVMVSGKPVPHSGHTHTISVFYRFAWGWNNIRPYLSSVHMLQITPATFSDNVNSVQTPAAVAPVALFSN